MKYYELSLLAVGLIYYYYYSVNSTSEKTKTISNKVIKQLNN